MTYYKVINSKRKWKVGHGDRVDIFISYPIAVIEPLTKHFRKKILIHFKILCYSTLSQGDQGGRQLKQLFTYILI